MPRPKRATIAEPVAQPQPQPTPSSPQRQDQSFHSENEPTSIHYLPEDSPAKPEEVTTAEFPVSNYQPHRILDIEKHSEESFHFIVAFTHVFDPKIIKNFCIPSLDILSKQGKIWLLSLFKRSLKDLLVLKNMRNWAATRTNYLRELCPMLNLDFSQLNFCVELPPKNLMAVKSTPRARRLSFDLHEKWETDTEKLKQKILKRRKRSRYARLNPSNFSLNSSFMDEETQVVANVKNQVFTIRNYHKKMNSFVGKLRDFQQNDMSKEELLHDLIELQNV